ncbi:MAG: TIGR03617 family F420-dependent LLM class oxidoreductase [Acidimicrobiales bacterium]
MRAVLVDGAIGFDARDVAERAAALEAEGFDGIWSAETGHDPLLTLALAAPATSRVALGTAIVVAFGRSPLITATMANDLQLLSGGRLLLGLGSQIKPHIEKRYSMPWSHPAARMREYVLAMRAIWSSWHEGTRLFFRGEFYRHTLMTPFFNPGPNPYGPPKVFVAAVGERMTEVAGEVADGLLVHPFTTERYLREVTLPALERGLASSGRGREAVEVALSGMVVAGEDEDARRRHALETRRQIAFYASTPAYRGVLDLHGWGGLQSRLNEMSREGRWEEMGELIDDEMLDAFSVVGPSEALGRAVLERFAGVVDRFSVYPAAHLGAGEITAIRTQLQRG